MHSALHCTFARKQEGSFLISQEPGAVPSSSSAHPKQPHLSSRGWQVHNPRPRPTLTLPPLEEWTRACIHRDSKRGGGGSVGLLTSGQDQRAAHHHNGDLAFLPCVCFEAQMFWFQVMTPIAHSDATCTYTSTTAGRWRGWRAVDAAVSTFHLPNLAGLVCQISHISFFPYYYQYTHTHHRQATPPPPTAAAVLARGVVVWFVVKARGKQ